MPKFEIPNFDLQNFELPVAFREFAEKSIAQAKDAYDKVKLAAEEATGVLEDTCSTAVKGAADYNSKVIEAARNNVNSVFDFANQLVNVKSVSEIAELSTAHARKQFEIFTEQAKELVSLAQKVATDTAEPMKTGVTKVFRKVA